MPNVLAVAAHPDDIEFVMAGTLLRLAELGWGVFYMNVANGCLGSMTTQPPETARIRLAEAQRAAALIPAVHFPPICDDMSIYYTPENLAKVAAVVRQADPTIVLTHSRSTTWRIMKPPAVWLSQRRLSKGCPATSHHQASRRSRAKWRFTTHRHTEIAPP